MASFLFASSSKGETGGEEDYLTIKKASPHTKYADFLNSLDISFNSVTRF